MRYTLQNALVKESSLPESKHRDGSGKTESDWPVYKFQLL